MKTQGTLFEFSQLGLLQVSGSYLHKQKKWLQKQKCDERLVESYVF